MLRRCGEWLLERVVFLCGLPWDTLLLWRWCKFYTAQCGHKTAIHGVVRTADASQITSIREDPIPYCHRCLEKMAIRCAVCGNIIFIGDTVSLPFRKTIDPGSTWFDEDKKVAVACCRDTCIDTIALTAGRWFPPGEVSMLPKL